MVRVVALRHAPVALRDGSPVSPLPLAEEDVVRGEMRARGPVSDHVLKSPPATVGRAGSITSRASANASAWRIRVPFPVSNVRSSVEATSRCRLTTRTGPPGPATVAATATFLPASKGSSMAVGSASGSVDSTALPRSSRRPSSVWGPFLDDGTYTSESPQRSATWAMSRISPGRSSGPSRHGMLGWGSRSGMRADRRRASCNRSTKGRREAGGVRPAPHSWPSSAARKAGTSPVPTDTFHATTVSVRAPAGDVLAPPGSRRTMGAPTVAHQASSFARSPLFVGPNQAMGSRDLSA
jgi:hypothetical protein